VGAAIGSAVGVTVGSGADMAPQAVANRDSITINSKYRMVRFMFFLLLWSWFGQFRDVESRRDVSRHSLPFFIFHSS
jgi:hypothetical protein